MVGAGSGPVWEKKTCNLVILKVDVSGSRNEHILLVGTVSSKGKVTPCSKPLFW